ncbi:MULTISPECIES: tetratricopeptide repeat protein [Rhodomicrobium]|uniref:tetratricopeptide repeat protein n=1 Tax=Rhodomicrobium TaxID=1068 RepID=UPI0014839AC8|nr:MULTISPECIES: tetratricopeptide repeat protein [Rhodomicrobium]
MKPLVAPKQSLRKARAELLATLYDQLKAAESDESAELIVSAIEKVWGSSGSDTADLLMQRAGLAVKNRNYDLALQILSGLTAIEPRYTEGWNQLATIYFLQEDYKQAMRQLRQVLALEPRHFKAIEGLGIILRETGSNDAALRATRRALEINPHLKSAKQAEEELSREVEGQGL